MYLQPIPLPKLPVPMSACLVVFTWVLQEADWVRCIGDLLGETRVN